ncbi:MAG: serine/threonine protein kinase, partial [Acidimicrobiales bacterium]
MGVRPVLADRYQLGPVLGRGGMAVVYQGVDDRLDRQVAIKVLRADLAADPGLRSRFEAEARSAARLVHPNVVSVFDTGESGGRPYIVMERLSGETLADLIRTGPLGEVQVTRMGAEVLAALSMAHGAGIIHRDIKPGNILVAGNGSVKVADFGIARAGDALESLTQTGAVMGTATYLSPEQA